MSFNPMDFPTVWTDRHAYIVHTLKGFRIGPTWFNISPYRAMFPQLSMKTQLQPKELNVSEYVVVRNRTSCTLQHSGAKCAR